MQTGGGREKIWQRTKEGWKEGWREYTRDEKISGEDMNKGEERSHVKTIGRRKLVGGTSMPPNVQLKAHFLCSSKSKGFYWVSKKLMEEYFSYIKGLFKSLL